MGPSGPSRVIHANNQVHDVVSADSVASDEPCSPPTTR